MNSDEMDDRFICPKCGGSFFGFAGEESDGSLKRYCKTHNCGFRWNSKDDSEYFYVCVKRKDIPKSE